MSSVHALQLRGEAVREAKRAKMTEETRQKIETARAKRQEIIDRGQAEARRLRQEAQE